MKKTLLFLLVSIMAAGLYAQDMPTGEYFYIQSVQPGRKSNLGYWDLPGYNPAYKCGESIKVYKYEGAVNDRLFRLKDAGNGYYYIYPKNAGEKGRVDVAGNAKGNGVNITVWDCNNSGAQLFKFKHMGDGRYKIYTRKGDVVCLDRRSHEDRTNVHCWEDHNGAWMEWYLVKKNGQVYKPVDYPATPDFFTLNKDKVFKSTSSTMVGTRVSYCKVIETNRKWVEIYGRSEGWSEAYGKDTVLHHMYKIYYDSKTGTYRIGTDDYAEVGKVSADGMTLSLDGDQSGTTFTLSGASISKVFEPTPLFFETFRNATFQFEQYYTVSSDKGTATISKIEDNKIYFEVTAPRYDEEAKKRVEKTFEIVIDYADGRYSYGPYDPHMQPKGYVHWWRKQLDMKGEEGGITLTVTK